MIVIIFNMENEPTLIVIIISESHDYLRNNETTMLPDLKVLKKFCIYSLDKQF